MFRTFLWKSLHNTHKIGNYWDNIENYSHHGLCTKCRVTENLEHILLECDIPGQRVVWKNVKELWLKKHENWPEPINIGTITGCGLIEVKSREGTVLKGESRAYQILISASAHLIWKLRCTRIYSDKPDDEWPENPEIQNRWLATINSWLLLDRSSTSQHYGKKATKQKTVLETWKNLLKDEDKLPKNWLKSSGVLVGVNQMDPHCGMPDNPDEPP